jgi:hypothetical protein
MGAHAVVRHSASLDLCVPTACALHVPLGATKIKWDKPSASCALQADLVLVNRIKVNAMEHVKKATGMSCFLIRVRVVAWIS